MLRIKVELVPFGQEEDTTEIAEMVIANDGTGNELTGNYSGWLQENGKKQFGRIENYSRRQPIWELVRLMTEAILLEDHKPDKNKTSVDQKLKKRLS